MVHNQYQLSGGEDQVFLNEEELLKSKNEDVLTYTVSNDGIDSSLKSKLAIGVNAIWSHKEYKNFKEFLQEKMPDIVHVHNFFPLISPSLYYVCSNLNIPVVQTLHNYRLICPAATFLRNNEICEKCLTGSLINSVKYGCYRESSLQTIPVAAMIAVNKAMNTWSSKVDRYITLTNFAKEKFIESGIPDEKITVKPNFVQQKDDSELLYDRENYFLFVGRISEEKGLDLLLEAWNELNQLEKMPLIIVGDGPEKKDLEKKYKHNKQIIFKGKLSNKETLTYMKKAKFLVVPSICYEGFPMTILEAYSVGTPVIASNIGSLQEVVKNNYTGFLFSKGDQKSLLSVIQKAIFYVDYKNLIENTRHEFNANYTADINYNQLNQIYKAAIHSKKSV